MRVIVAGSRGFTLEDYEVVENACLMSGYWYTVVLSGKADGVDALGERFAARIGVPVEPYPADWKRLGNTAGRIRNVRMAENADALVAVWDGSSPGTKHMIETARARGLLVHVRLAQPTSLMPATPYR